MTLRPCHCCIKFFSVPLRNLTDTRKRINILMYGEDPVITVKVWMGADLWFNRDFQTLNGTLS
jgi:hypothetical protein